MNDTKTYHRTMRRETDEQSIESIEEMAVNCLSDDEVRKVVDLDAHATLYIQGCYDLNPADFDGEEALSEAMTARRDGALLVVDAHPGGGQSGAVALTDDDKAEWRADACLGFEEVAIAQENHMSSREYVLKKYGHDAGDFETQIGLERAIRTTRKSGETNNVN